MKTHRLAMLSWPVVSALAAFTLAGCASAPRPSGPQSFAVAGPTFGAYEIRPTVCIAGQHFVFWGADLGDEKTGAIARLIIDPITGPVVRLFKFSDPYGPSIVVARADCKTFKTELNRIGSMINGIDVVKVDLDLDCATRNGDFVVGKAAFDECR